MCGGQGRAAKHPDDLNQAEHGSPRMATERALQVTVHAIKEVVGGPAAAEQQEGQVECL